MESTSEHAHAACEQRAARVGQNGSRVNAKVGAQCDQEGQTRARSAAKSLRDRHSSRPGGGRPPPLPMSPPSRNRPPPPRPYSSLSGGPPLPPPFQGGGPPRKSSRGGHHGRGSLHLVRRHESRLCGQSGCLRVPQGPRLVPRTAEATAGQNAQPRSCVAWDHLHLLQHVPWVGVRLRALFQDHLHKRVKKERVRTQMTAASGERAETEKPGKAERGNLRIRRVVSHDLYVASPWSHRLHQAVPATHANKKE